MGEKHIIEYKRQWDDEWLKWICGLANAEGGTMYIGITDAETVWGLKNAKKLMEDIPNKLADKMRLYPDVRLLERGGKEIIEIEISPSQDAVTLDGILYKRVGSTNQIVKGQALKDFYARKMNATWDSRVIRNATIEAIDPEAIKYFLRKGIDKGRLPKDSINDSIEKVLKNLEVMTEDGELTIAALLLFGKNPQHYCLNARIKIGRFGATQAALMNQDLIGGDLIRMADRVMEALDAKYLIRPIHYEGMQRIEPLEIPEDGLREILYNAICHKDYNGPDSLLRVFDDRITFWNQGPLPSEITPESIYRPHDSHPRNRLIANAFYMAGFVEAWGRGYELITEAFKKEGLELPTMIEAEGGVRIIIKREIFYGIQQGGRIDPKTGRLIKADDTKNVTDNVTDDNLRELTERQRVIIGMLPFDDTEDVTETTSTLAQKTGVSRRTIARDMDALKEKGFVIRIGPDNGGYWKRLK